MYFNTCIQVLIDNVQIRQSITDETKKRLLWPLLGSFIIRSDMWSRHIMKTSLADCVSTPAGSVPATGFLKQSGVHMDSKGFITVNKVFHKVYNLSDGVVSLFVFSIIYTVKPSPRWCRPMLMGSLLEEMWWFFLFHHVTTRRWTSLTGKWLMYTVSVSSDTIYRRVFLGPKEST